MKNKMLMILGAFVPILFAGPLMAQNNTVASGADVSGSGGSVSYTVGQIEYETLSSSAGTITQGIQQPYEIWSVSIDEPESQFEFNLFPNPSVDYITLRVEGLPTNDLSYRIYDMNGKLLKTGSIYSTDTFISMEELANATYLVKVSDAKKDYKIFKVLKNQAH